jgi:hypothetical protein
MLERKSCTKETYSRTKETFTICFESQSLSASNLGDLDQGRSLINPTQTYVTLVFPFRTWVDRMTTLSSRETTLNRDAITLTLRLTKTTEDEGFGFSIEESPNQGSQVCRIVACSPADKAGLQINDMIRTVDGHDLTQARILEVKKVRHTTLFPFCRLQALASPAHRIMQNGRSILALL